MISEGNQVNVIYTYLKKINANSVNRKIVVEKFNLIGIEDPFLFWINSYIYI